MITIQYKRLEKITVSGHIKLRNLRAPKVLNPNLKYENRYLRPQTHANELNKLTSDNIQCKMVYKAILNAVEIATKMAF